MARSARTSRALLLCSLSGALACGRIEYSVDGGVAGLDARAVSDASEPHDVASDVHRGSDAATGLVPCDWASPRFDPPSPIFGGVIDPYALSLSPDGLELYFTVLGVVQIARRPRVDAPFSDPGRLEEVFDAAYRVDGVTFRRDRLELLMASAELGGAGLADLFRRARPSTSDPWGAPTPLTALNTADYDWDYFLEPDGLTLWFQRQTMDPASPDVFRAVRATPDAPFGPGAAVPNLSVAGIPESAPSLPDDRAVVVASVGQDIQFARMLADSPGPPIPLPELNTAEVEYEPAVRSDGCEILFVSNRDGTMRMYQSRRAP